MPLPWSRRPAHTAPAYVDTPVGLLGAGGTHFRATEAMLEDYAGPLFEREPLAAFVRRAEAWLEAPRTLAVALLPAWLYVLPWGTALAATAGTYLLAALAAPAFASRAAAAVVRVLAHPVAQAALLIVVLTLLAQAERYGAVWAGLGAFVVLRVGLVERLLGGPLAALHARLYPLPPADQALRAFLLRGAIRHGITLPGLEATDASVRGVWERVRMRPPGARGAGKR